MIVSPFLQNSGHNDVFAFVFKKSGGKISGNFQ